MRYLTLCFLLVGALPAQTNWLLRAPTPSLPGRFGHALVHDPATSRTFALWGIGSGGSGLGCHMYDGTTWSACNVTSTGGGPGLWVARDAAVVADGAGGLLVFGGWRPGVGIGGGMPAVLDQTWRGVATANGDLTFTQLQPAAHPSARQGAAMGRTNQGVLLFGGCTVDGAPVPITYFADTWLFNGSTWNQLSPPQSPPARSHAAMAFDAARGVAVLFGGRNAAADTWEFDGASWTQRSPAAAPSARSRAAFGWDPASGRCVLFGGELTNGTADGSTWTWDGTAWTAPMTFGAPGARLGAAMTFDASQQRLLLHGGRDLSYFADTYHVEQLTGVANYAPFGVGCPDPDGTVPSLAASPGERPVLGSTSHLVVSDLPVALTLPVFVLGTSTTFDAIGGHPLPLDLGILGWPGCQQLVSHEVLDPRPTVTGSATFAMAVPAALPLVGFAFHAQVLVLYVPSGAAVSNALTGVVGF